MSDLSKVINRRQVLASRPQGAPTAQNFRLETAKVSEPAEGEVLLRTLYLSLDPYMRGRMSDAPSYAEPVAVGDVMVGGTVAQVVASHHQGYAVGDLVLSDAGWQEYALSTGVGLTKLGSIAQPSWALGVLGMPGFTAYVGLLDIGKPKAGETVVVAAATGAVGSIVGQIAKIKGCYVVGVAGGADKCRAAVDELGFDACIDRNAADFAEQLAQACPQGIDVYFENVGGAVFNAVLPLLNISARVPVCGLIASYNAEHLPEGGDHVPLLMAAILRKRIKVEGFIILDHYALRYPEFFKEMSGWLAEGKIIFKEDFVEGLENAPQAFIGLLEGKNFGKLVVKVADVD